MSQRTTIKVIDFFAGCGGTSLGFKRAGMEIKCAIDIDTDALSSLKSNMPEVECLNQDIRNLSIPEIAKHIDNESEVLFSACAPCQPFTRQVTRKKENDSRVDLLQEFQRFVEACRPHHIFIENVPGLQDSLKYKESPLTLFINFIVSQGYTYEVKIVSVANYGVPQTRKRLILLASRIRDIKFPAFTNGNTPQAKPFSTVRDWISSLPSLEAGEVDRCDAEHQASGLSLLNLERIRHTPEGGGRLDWPAHLRLKCHNDYKGHTDVYGRMHWDKPASGLTTRCISYSNGRFGHPEQDRAISLREAGLLQTFPPNFKWSGSLQSKARQIGNAVPPLLASNLAKAFTS